MPSPENSTKTAVTAGFTLIELSVVLVIIGLIVGGVLVGKEMIGQATIRAQITQIGRYNEAVNTFYNKYNCLPGDCAQAQSFGFPFRGPYAGEGDGNGVIQTNWKNCSGCVFTGGAGSGETGLFWVDLSMAHLIDETFNTATAIVVLEFNILPGPYMPQAKIGNGNYVYVWSGGYAATTSSGDNLNYFGISAVTNIGDSECTNCILSNPGMTVNQAYSIDTKIDDGAPQSGNVIAMYIAGNISNQGTAGLPAMYWAGGPSSWPYTTATPGSSTTCFDNGNVAGATQQYSTEQSGGNGMNCSLSFQMQGAAR
jgi:prepilin-type N-terminal cleavage/methylation domain-containing protein